MADMIFSGVTFNGGFSITPPSTTAPDAPTIGTATTTGSTTATVAFTAPASDGGSTITSYTATSSPGGITGTLSQAGSGTINMTGLTTGTSYTFTVTATNSIGTSSPSSASNSITTYAVPGAPTIGTATSTGTTTATVAFTAPASDGGATITTYTATSSPGGITGTLSQAGSGTINMTGLTGATSYTFTVTATNSIGTSSPSSASNSITTDTPITYYMNAFGTNGTGEELGNPKALTINSSGTLNMVGYASAGLIAQFSSAGAVIWQRTLTGSATNFLSSTTDSSGNVYAVGYSNFPSSGANLDMILVKYNSSGTLQWQTALGVGSSQNEFGYGVAVDSTGNIYVASSYSTGGGAGSRDHAFLAKYNTSGVIQWQRTFATASYDYFRAVTVDTSDNIYAIGSTTISAQNAACIVKYNSSGAVQWQVGLTGVSGGLPCEFTAGVIDSSGNIFVVGSTFVSGTQYGIILKYNSSGTLQWQRRLGNSGTVNILRDCSLDSSGNVYVVGYSATNFLAAKYNTSGTIQWQRTVNFGASYFGQGHSALVDGTSYYMGGLTNAETPASNSIFITKLPTDGSLTGTYTVNGKPIVYAVSTLTETALTFTGTTSTATAGTGSLTGGTSSMTNATSTFTSSVTNVP